MVTELALFALLLQQHSRALLLPLAHRSEAVLLAFLVARLKAELLLVYELQLLNVVLIV